MFGAIFLGGLLSIVIISFKFTKFEFIKIISKNDKKKGFLLGLSLQVLLMVVLLFTIGFINAFIAILHLFIFWIISDLIGGFIVKKRKSETKCYYAGAAAIIFTGLYLLTGAFLAYNVWETSYELSTDKELGNLKVAMIADSHVGTTFDGEGFEKRMMALNDTKPDIVVVAGDFVDDDTTKEDMIKSCQVLGNLDTKYGVYFSFGNHDKGYFNSRGYTGEDLLNELEKNNVIVLQDESILLDDRFYVIGRQDRSVDMMGGKRAGMNELVKDLDKSKYMIVIDHQPHDYEAQAESGVDLVLSGHTHGGQVFPGNLVEALFRTDDKVYGHEKRGNTDFIVTSGISDWAIIFKTCCYSEFVTCNIK